MVQRNLTPGGDKNGADINLALDALEMAFTHPHINAFVIVGGDSDFISLVEKLKQYDKKVFVVGGRQFTSVIMQRNCHEFIAYENLAGSGGGGGGRRQPGRDVRVERAPLDQARPLVARALKVLSEREVSPQIGLLKSTLLQLDSTFSERNYGAGSFRDFVEKLEKIGVVRLQQSKGGLIVEATEDGQAAEVAPAAEPSPAVEPAESAPRGRENGQAKGPVAVAGTTVEGLQEFRRILASAQIRRWPMYLRNVKQMIRQASPVFDERAYGYGNLVDLLRAAQRDGLLRVERDRQGVIRVFQGATPLTPAPSIEVMAPEPDTFVDGMAVIEAVAVEISAADEEPAPEVSIVEIQEEPAAEMPADRGRGRSRRPRSGAGRSPKPRRARKKATPSS
jgi:hypothetical protein